MIPFLHNMKNSIEIKPMNVDLCMPPPLTHIYSLLLFSLLNPRPRIFFIDSKERETSSERETSISSLSYKPRPGMKPPT